LAKNIQLFSLFFIGRENKGLKQTIGTWAKKTGLEHNRNLVSILLNFFTPMLWQNKLEYLSDTIMFQACLIFVGKGLP
jgi:hypothetical protein